MSLNASPASSSVPKLIDKICKEEEDKILKFLEINEKILGRKNNEEIIETERTRMGNTPFLIACRRGYVKLVSLFLEQYKINLEQCNSNGDNCLMMCCSNNQVECFKYLLTRVKSVPQLKLLLEKTNTHGFTCMAYAVFGLSSEIIDFIASKQFKRLFNDEMKDTFSNIFAMKEHGTKNTCLHLLLLSIINNKNKNNMNTDESKNMSRLKQILEILLFKFNSNPYVKNSINISPLNVS